MSDESQKTESRWKRQFVRCTHIFQESKYQLQATASALQRATSHWYWQSLSTVLHNSTWTNIIPPLYEDDASKLLIFNSHTAVSEIMVAIGTIMAHYIVQLHVFHNDGENR